MYSNSIQFLIRELKVPLFHTLVILCDNLSTTYLVGCEPCSTQRRKYRDMSAIYRVLKGVNTIFHGEISIQRNFGRNPKKSTISGDFGDKSPIFPDISHGQRGLRKRSFLLLLREFEPPKPKSLRFNPLTVWANLPLLYNTH